MTPSIATEEDSGLSDDDVVFMNWFAQVLRACRNDLVGRLLDQSPGPHPSFTTQQYAVAWLGKHVREPLSAPAARGHLSKCPLVVEIEPDVWGERPLTPEEEKFCTERAHAGFPLLQQAIQKYREQHEQGSPSE